jgi:hypothetical protein
MCFSFVLIRFLALDGALTAALRIADGYVVHGLDRSAARVERA